jgi:LmbE family N-acetylglucosaminyl deacetylase
VGSDCLGSAEDFVKAFYDTIVLSPHLDDAVLSCGGQIVMQTFDGQSVLVVTIMAGDPPVADLSLYAQQLHARWEITTEAAARRREEDQSACRVLRADYLHWAIPDCIYRYDQRTGETYYNSDQDIFGPVHAKEKHLQDKLAEKMANLPGYGRILAPLSVGNHVDHQLTRLAAESCFRNELIYYEEFPYSAKAGAVNKVIAAERDTWHSKTVTLTQEAMEKKIEAIATYASQLSTFFRDRDDLEQQVHNYSQLIGGERIWFPNPPGNVNSNR